ncbi:MAG TPA: PD-(D/E)XK nuclease family protein [Elusimicrobiales bacterium]|nr:PD-(D/E)XK nuclease family protein [Elusimicrobiales bacterium]
MSRKKTDHDPRQDLFGGATAPAERPAVSGPAALAFSFSKLSLYEECPLKYRFKYIDKLPEKPKPYFAFGNSVHAALEFFHDPSHKEAPPLEKLLSAFREEWEAKDWREKGYSDPSRSDADYQAGLKMLTGYYKKHHAAFSPPFMVEYSTDVAVDGLLVRIIADKIEHAGNGELVLIDYKTGRDVKRSPDQLHMYQKICELDPKLRERLAERYGVPAASLRVRELRFYHVPSLKEYTFARADDFEIGLFWERVLRAADGVKEGRFPARPGDFQCRFCDFRSSCPVHAEASPRAAEGLEELAAEYEAARGRAEALKIKLVAALKAMPGGAAETGSFSLKLKKGPRWSFRDREAVRALLREHGCYDRACAPLLSRVAELVDDESLPAEARRALRELAEPAETFEIELKRRRE